ncbi:hypothetical protein C0583_03800 [Candidatus Parcubacteria bacterium]|nr:MAG: hypothetical protein C0583_03800 [Candidatus Parcubacteria bacterium]
MIKIREKIERFVYSGKIQGPGSFGILKMIKYVAKAVDRGKIVGLFSYLKFITLPKKTVLISKPFVMACFVNSKCNLNCPYYCYGVPDDSHLGSQYGGKALLGGCRNMTIDDFKKISNHEVFKNSLAAIFSGGEPLLNKDFFKILDYAGKKFPVIHLTTNGTLMADYVDKIIESPLTHINISLDAYSAEEYKKMRDKENGKELFDRVVKNIKNLVKKKEQNNKDLEIIISTVVGKLNYKNMQKMIDFAKSLGVNSLNFQNIVGFDNGELEKETLMIEDQEVKDFITSLKEKNSDFHVTYPRILSKDKSIRGCRQPFDSLTIDADGNIGPCSVMVPNPNNNFGNIFKDKDVWNSKEITGLRSSLLDGEKSLGSHFCKDCTFLNGKIF